MPITAFTNPVAVNGKPSAEAHYGPWASVEAYKAWYSQNFTGPLLQGTTIAVSTSTGLVEYYNGGSDVNTFTQKIVNVDTSTFLTQTQAASTYATQQSVTQALAQKADTSTLVSTYATQQSVTSALSLKADITALPTKTSQLINDSDFVNTSYHDTTKLDTTEAISTYEPKVHAAATYLSIEDAEATYPTKQAVADTYSTKAALQQVVDSLESSSLGHASSLFGTAVYSTSAPLSGGSITPSYSFILVIDGSIRPSYTSFTLVTQLTGVTINPQTGAVTFGPSETDREVTVKATISANLSGATFEQTCEATAKQGAGTTIIEPPTFAGHTIPDIIYGLGGFADRPTADTTIQPGRQL